MSHQSCNKISNQVSNVKDKINSLYQYNVVYKINCNQCDSTYIEETGGSLSTVLNEHQQDIVKRMQLSQVFQHTSLFSHTFNFDNTKVLHKENNVHNRKMLETFYTPNNATSINQAIDIPSQFNPNIDYT